MLGLAVTQACAGAPPTPGAEPPAGQTPPPSGTPVGSSGAAGTAEPAVPSVAAADAGAGAPDSSMCRGANLELERALWSRACAVEERRARDVATKLPPSAVGLEARVGNAELKVGQAIDLRLSIVNKTAVRLEVPFYAALDLDWVRVAAVGKNKKSLPLAPVEPGVTRSDYTSADGGHYLLIELEPGGRAEARVAVVPEVTEESLAHCPPQAKCAPRQVKKGLLRAGRYALSPHLGPLLVFDDAFRFETVSVRVTP